MHAHACSTGVISMLHRCHPQLACMRGVTTPELACKLCTSMHILSRLCQASLWSAARTGGWLFLIAAATVLPSRRRTQSTGPGHPATHHVVRPWRAGHKMAAARTLETHRQQGAAGPLQTYGGIGHNDALSPAHPERGCDRSCARRPPQTLLRPACALHLCSPTLPRQSRPRRGLPALQGKYRKVEPVRINE